MKENRILKRIKKDGTSDFIVEYRIKLFGRVIRDWSTDKILIGTDDIMTHKIDAVFDNLEDAKEFIGESSKQVIKTEEIK